MQTEAFCHHSLSIFQSSCAHVAQDGLKHPHVERRRKGSNSLVCPITGLCTPASVMMSESKSQQCLVFQGIARAKAHGEFKLSNSNIRFTLPASNKTPSMKCLGIGRI